MADTTPQTSALSCPSRDWFWIPRVLIPLVLIAAALLKIHQLATQPPLGKGFLASRWVNLAEADFEIAMALWLLSGWARRLSWLASLLMFTAFSVVTATKFIHGEASCGCFGRLTVPPQYTLMLDLAIVAMLAVVRPRTAAWWPFTQWRRFLIAWAIAIPVMVATAIPVLRFSPAKLAADGSLDNADRTVLLEPETWVGRPLPIASYIDIADDLKQGDWLVVLVHDGCAGCRALVPDLAAKARAVGPGRIAKVALIHMPPHTEASEFVYKDALFLNGQIDSSRDWFVQTPAVLRLRDGRVTDVVIALGDANRRKVLDGELPVVAAAESQQTIDASPGSGRAVLFVVRNPGPKPIVIGHVTIRTRDTSGSIVAQNCPGRIPAHSFALVNLSVRTSSESPADWEGEVGLQPGDADTPEIILKVRVRVRH
ncbi:MAG: hypothetical protein PHU85_13155 [Phycisphaerae bacterium]|nr:hypothetical protein [Phycisphaerae bacterium]